VNRELRLHRHAPNIIGLIALLLALAASGQSLEGPAAPSAEAVLDHMAAASGSQEAFDAVEARVSRGRMEIAGTGISGSLTVYEQRGGSSLAVFEAPALGSVRSGTNGEIAWEVSDVAGPRLLEGGERTFALRSAMLDASHRWRELYSAFRLTGSAVVDDTPCWELEITPNHGPVETWCVAVDSGFLLRHSMIMESALGDIPVESTFSDFREVDGITIPFTTVQRMLTQEVVTTIDSVERNPDLPADIFEIPAEIAALVEKASVTHQ
jgi:hypothetical protein